MNKSALFKKMLSLNHHYGFQGSSHFKEEALVPNGQQFALGSKASGMVWFCFQNNRVSFLDIKK